MDNQARKWNQTGEQPQLKVNIIPSSPAERIHPPSRLAQNKRPERGKLNLQHGIFSLKHTKEKTILGSKLVSKFNVQTRQTDSDLAIRNLLHKTHPKKQKICPHSPRSELFSEHPPTLPSRLPCSFAIDFWLLLQSFLPPVSCVPAFVLWLKCS